MTSFGRNEKLKVFVRYLHFTNNLIEMIYSDSDDTTKLPIQFILIHDFCCDLLMDIVPFLTDPQYVELRNLSIKFDKKDIQKIEKLDAIQLLEWLQRNGHRSEYEKFFLIRVFEGILADFCEYVEFSLIASRRSRINVALNLVRKPFLENLIVFEQILSKPQEFVDIFTNESPSKYNPVKELDKKGLIRNCIEKAGKNIFFNANLIYTLRYDQDNPNSYYALSNRAVHLVTTRNKSYETEKQNYNLIFVPESNYIDFWDHYYNFFPLILYYAVEVIEAIVRREVIQLEEEYQFRRFCRLIGFLFISELLYPKEAKEASALDKFSGKFNLNCPICKKENILFKSDYHEIFSDRTLCCKHCLNDMIADKKILINFYESFI